jgi:hypothetical protein
MSATAPAPLIPRELWEYRLVPRREARLCDLEAFLNYFGGEGWELVCIEYETFIFKRKT